MTILEIGRLLRASTTGCVVGCRVSQLTVPAFGGMVRISLTDGSHIFGLIYDIHIDDDGLVRQLVTAEHLDEDVILDNRQNRNVPVEISVLFIGYRQADKIWHLLPPRPPLTLDAIYPCTEEEICAFTSTGHFGYFRHVLNNPDLPIGELLAAHLAQTGRAQQAIGNQHWLDDATQEIITLLRDDYATLNKVLGAIGEIYS